MEYEVEDEVDWDSFPKNLTIEKVKLQKLTDSFGQWKLTIKFEDELHVILWLVTDDKRDPSKMDYGDCEYFQGCCQLHGYCEREFCGKHNPLQHISWEVDLGKLVGRKIHSIGEYNATQSYCEFQIVLDDGEIVKGIINNGFTDKYHESERYGYNLNIYTFPY